LLFRPSTIQLETVTMLMSCVWAVLMPITVPKSQLSITMRAEPPTKIDTPVAVENVVSPLDTIFLYVISPADGIIIFCVTFPKRTRPSITSSYPETLRPAAEFRQDDPPEITGYPVALAACVWMPLVPLEWETFPLIVPAAVAVPSLKLRPTAAAPTNVLLVNVPPTSLIDVKKLPPAMVLIMMLESSVQLVPVVVDILRGAIPTVVDMFQSPLLENV
jgi:hypothetical protein